MACTILQKQIECIDGKKENIIVPSVTMKKIRQRQQTGKLPRSCIYGSVCMNDIVEGRTREQVDTPSSSTHSSDGSEVTMTTSSSESTSDSATSTSSGMMREDQQEKKSAKRAISGQSEGNNSSPVNPCVLCLEEEKRLACIPCGHLATCVPCGHSLRSCPICRRGIDAFVRIYL